uniref:Uncharacterized protein n=1 Tax=Arundo donax TaxID=35708 RepID=A0A0A9HE62_ARUDO
MSLNHHQQHDHQLLQEQGDQQPDWVQPLVSDALKRILGTALPETHGSWKHASSVLPSINCSIQLNINLSSTGTHQQLVIPIGQWKSMERGESFGTKSLQPSLQIQELSEPVPKTQQLVPIYPRPPLFPQLRNLL